MNEQANHAQEPALMRKTLDWRRVRAGWYVAAMAPGENKTLYVHVCRVSETRPRWGWDVYVSDSEHEVPGRTRIVFSGLTDLCWAKLEAENRYGEYRAVKGGAA